jgi:plastocyanin
MRKFIRTITVIIISLTVFVISCKDDDHVSPNEVSIGDDTFSPASITVSKGTTIKWTNHGADIHTVTNISALFNSGDLDPGDTYSRTFDSIGNFPYQCIYHLGMNGTVIVN